MRVFDRRKCCPIWQGEPTIGEPEKCSELRWADLDDLPPNLVPYVRAMLDHLRRDRIYSEHWPSS
jgi:hypothetical protein